MPESSTITRLRKAHGWSIRELARRTGVSVSGLARAEHGTHTLGPEALSSVLDALRAEDADRVSAHHELDVIPREVRAKLREDRRFLACVAAMAASWGEP